MSFDLIAPVYDTLSQLVFGRALQQAQLVFLAEVPSNSSILVVGGGTGLLLAEVLTQCQPGRVLFVEASEKMVAKARRRVQHHPLADRVTFRHGTEASLRPDETFDVLMLPFVLDVSPEPVLTGQFLPPLLRATEAGGTWLVTDFIPSPRLHHRLLLQTMYLFFRLVSGLNAHKLPDWPRILTQTGLTQTKQKLAAGGQVQTGIWRLQPLE